MASGLVHKTWQDVGGGVVCGGGRGVAHWIDVLVQYLNTFHLLVSIILSLPFALVASQIA